MVDLLVENGADVDGLGYEGGNAVILSSYFVEIEKLERLIFHGANVNSPATSDDRRTALHVAAGFGYKGPESLKVIRILLDNGADADSLDHKGQTPLHWAVVHKNADAIPILVEAGAQVPVFIHLSSCESLMRYTFRSHLSRATQSAWSPRSAQSAGVSPSKGSNTMRFVSLY